MMYRTSLLYLIVPHNKATPSPDCSFFFSFENGSKGKGKKIHGVSVNSKQMFFFNKIQMCLTQRTANFNKEPK